MGTCCWYYANRSTMAKLLVVGLFALVAIACAMPIADNAPEDHSEGTTAVAEVGDKRDGAGGGCCCCPCCECHDCSTTTTAATSTTTTTTSTAVTTVTTTTTTTASTTTTTTTATPTVSTTASTTDATAHAEETEEPEESEEPKEPDTERSKRRTKTMAQCSVFGALMWCFQWGDFTLPCWLDGWRAVLALQLHWLTLGGGDYKHPMCTLASSDSFVFSLLWCDGDSSVIEGTNRTSNGAGTPYLGKRFALCRFNEAGTRHSGASRIALWSAVVVVFMTVVTWASNALWEARGFCTCVNK